MIRVPKRSGTGIQIRNPVWTDFRRIEKIFAGGRNKTNKSWMGQISFFQGNDIKLSK